MKLIMNPKLYLIFMVIEYSLCLKIEESNIGEKLKMNDISTKTKNSIINKEKNAQMTQANKKLSRLEETVNEEHLEKEMNKPLHKTNRHSPRAMASKNSTVAKNAKLNKNDNKIKYKKNVDLIKNHYLRQKLLIEKDQKANFFLSKKQNELISKFNLMAKNLSNYDDSGNDRLFIKFFPYNGINEKTYQKMFEEVTSNSNSKVSQPFNTILSRIRLLFNKKIQNEMKNEIKRLRMLNIDEVTEEIVKFSEKIKKSKDNENIYWYYYYIVSNVILTGRNIFNKHTKKYETRTWNISESKYNVKNLEKDDDNKGGPMRRILAEGVDENYDALLKKDKEYSEILSFYRLLTLHQLVKTKAGREITKFVNETFYSNSKTGYIKYLKEKNSNIGNEKIKFKQYVIEANPEDTLQFKDFRMNIFLNREIQRTFFYKKLAKFPKGVIHHLHWSAAFFMGDIMIGLEKLIDEKYQKKLITVIIKGDVHVPDKTRPDDFYKIPSPRLFIILDFMGFLDKLYSGEYKNDIKNFKENYMLADGRCIIDPITPPNADNKVNPDVKAFYVFKYCKNSVLYSKVLNGNLKLDLTFINKYKIKPLSELTKFLENQSHILDSGARLKKDFMPESYKDLLYSVKDQESVAVWFKFETIFGIYSELFDNDSVFKNLNLILLSDLISDRVLGVEYRQKYDMGKPSSRMEILRNMTYHKIIQYENSSQLILDTKLPVSFILPGRKIKIDHKLKKLYEGLEDAKKKNDSLIAGFDFFGYEDDPFSGARNFFPFTLRKFNNDDISHLHKINDPKLIFNPNNSTYRHDNEFAFFLNMLRKGHKLYLHAGETIYFPNYPVDKKFLKKFYINDNLIHAALLPSVERLGHGFAVGSNDLLMNIYKRRNISLEICPVSNQALLYYDVSENPVTRLLREGVSVTISPDDPGLFFYSGVRMDWFNLFMQTDLLPSEYYLLIRNSILKSSIPEIIKNKEELLLKSKRQIEAFFEKDDYQKLRNAFPSDAELKKGLKIGKLISPKIFKSKKNQEEENLKHIKKNSRNLNNMKNNPYLDIYNIKDLIKYMSKNRSNY